LLIDRQLAIWVADCWLIGRVNQQSISLDDLLKARALNLEAERRRERMMRVEIAFPFRLRRARETR
jgi:hypothetical protein